MLINFARREDKELRRKVLEGRADRYEQRRYEKKIEKGEDRKIRRLEGDNNQKWISQRISDRNERRRQRGSKKQIIAQNFKNKKLKQSVAGYNLQVFTDRNRRKDNRAVIDPLLMAKRNRKYKLQSKKLNKVDNLATVLPKGNSSYPYPSYAVPTNRTIVKYNPNVKDYGTTKPSILKTGKRTALITGAGLGTIGLGTYLYNKYKERKRK